MRTVLALTLTGFTELVRPRVVVEGLDDLIQHGRVCGLEEAGAGVADGERMRAGSGERDGERGDAAGVECAGAEDGAAVHEGDGAGGGAVGRADGRGEDGVRAEDDRVHRAGERDRAEW